MSFRCTNPERFIPAARERPLACSSLVVTTNRLAESVAVAVPVAREARSGLDPWARAELPVPPSPTGLGWLAVVGPGVIVLGASIGSGEFLLGPAVFVRHGLSLLWVTTVAVFLQTVFNTELMRYTIATGEPIYTGFMRTRPSAAAWGLMRGDGHADEVF